MYAADQETTARAGTHPVDGLASEAAARALRGSVTTTRDETRGRTLSRPSTAAPGASLHD
jgi:hypothetical protein